MSIFSRGYKDVPSVLPTEKQMSLVKDMCIALGKKFPKENTKWAYQKFISENIEDYKAVIAFNREVEILLQYENWHNLILHD